MSRSEVCRALMNAGTVEFGEFTYASGAKGPIYIDLRRLVSFPKEMAVICHHLAEKMSELPDVDIVLGAATAGISFATLVSAETKTPMCYIRKKAKGHGTESQIEGVFKKDQRVLLLDDLVTSGASKKIFVEGARKAGLEIQSLLVILDRRPDDDGGAISGLDVKLHSLITLREFIDVLRKEGGATSDELAAVDLWLKGESK